MCECECPSPVGKGKHTNVQLSSQLRLPERGGVAKPKTTPEVLSRQKRSMPFDEMIGTYCPHFRISALVAISHTTFLDLTFVTLGTVAPGRLGAKNRGGFWFVAKVDATGG